MSTTSLKLPDSLKKRVLATSQHKGISPHAFMVGAIEQAASAAEQQAAFVADAMAAQQEMLSSGQGYDAEEVHAYIAARVSGLDTPRPKAKSWRK